MDFFKIRSFSGGVNEYVTESLLKSNEAVKAVNCNVDSGSLKTVKEPKTIQTMSDNIHSLSVYYDGTNENIITGVGTNLFKGTTDIYEISGSKLDTLNFEYKGNKILVGTSKDDTPFMISGSSVRKLKNRRPVYDEKTGDLKGYADANGNIKEKEADITTYAPNGDFIELHYDRLWIAGDKNNPDRLYFSTAGVNGADIEDFTMPTEEAEANMHGGFIDVRSYDGSKIIGLKVIFNAIVIFKNKSAYKIFGNSPSNYELVELFSSNGAIADKSICVGNNGAYFLNKDGIYFYDGTNTNLISQKIQNIVRRMNINYASSSVGYFYNNKYYLAIPVDGSSNNNLLVIYDTLTSSFVTRNIGNISGFIEYKNSLCISSDEYVKKLENGINNLPLYWETANYDYGRKDARKNSSYLYFRGKGDGSVKFTVKTEKKTKELIVPLTSTEQLYRKKLKNKGRIFKMIIENVNGSSFEVISPELLTEIDED
jgi:hypothetical protein